MKKLLLTLLTTSITLTSFAYAQDKPSYSYVGISVGSPSSKDTGDLSEKNEKNTAYKLFGGYSINKNISVESHYSNKLTSISDTNGDNYKMQSYGVSSIYKLPLKSNTPFVKLGYHKWKFSANEDNDPTVNTTGNDLFFGLGTSITLNDKVDFRIEAERFKYKHSEITGETNLYSAGVAYKF